MRMKEISFMSEHTAEYALVPDLAAKLGSRFSRVLPIYFLGTREGSRVGCESGRDQPFRVVAAFARRPKVTQAGTDSILVKVNDVLFSTAYAASQVGIAVLAGVPLISDLCDYCVGVPCTWFQISGHSELNADQELRLTLTGELQELKLPSGIAGPLTKAEIIDMAESQCRQLDWASALDGMRHVKSAGGMRHPIFGGGYRPFFMMMEGRDAQKR